MSDCPQTNMKADECGTCSALLSERDLAQHWADELAYAIGRLLNVDVGEHSNLNNPWLTAYEFIEAAIQEREEGERTMEQLAHDGQL